MKLALFFFDCGAGIVISFTHKCSYPVAKLLDNNKIVEVPPPCFRIIPMLIFTHFTFAGDVTWES